MNVIRLTSQVSVVIFALACGRDGGEADTVVGGMCSPDLSTDFVTAVLVDGGVALTQGGPSVGCQVPCDCDLACDCDGWEATLVPAAVGVYTEPETRCRVCCLDTGAEEIENSGTIEIERIDEWGVVGCAIGTCRGDFRFEAPWCVPE